MRSRWKSKQDLIESASKFHNLVRDILLNDPYWASIKAYQEVPVADLVPSYEYTNHHIDWYIDPFMTVIELHGMQHYRMVNFGNISYNDAQEEFRAIQQRDSLKKEALLDAGYRYLEVPYGLKGKLSGEFLRELVINKGEEREV